MTERAKDIKKVKCKFKLDSNCEKIGKGFWHTKRICDYCFWKKNNMGTGKPRGNRKTFPKTRNGKFTKPATFIMGEIKK